MSFKETPITGLRKRQPGFSEPEFFNTLEQSYGNYSSIIGEGSEIEETGGRDPKTKEEVTFGFQEKQENVISPIEVKNVNLSIGSFQLKHLAVSQKAIVGVTETCKVLRWKFEIGYSKYEVLDVPQKVSSSLGKLADVGNKIGDKIIRFKKYKEFQKDKQLRKERKLQIERAYFDHSGDHCIIANNYGHSYYLNYSQAYLKYLRKMKNIVAKCIEFDDRLPPKSLLDDKTFLIGSDNNQIYLGRLEYNTKDGGFNEIVPILLISVAEERPKSISDIKIFCSKDIRGIKTIILASSSSQIFFFVEEQGGQQVDLEQFFRKYQNRQSIEYSLPIPAGHISYTDICLEGDFERQGQFSTSFFYTNGNQLQYYRFSQQQQQQKDNQIELNDSFFRQVNYFQYAKLEGDESGQLKVLEMPLGIGITPYNYILLHSDSISVLSQITQQVTFYQKLNKLGKILGMINDMDNKCYWIYGENKVARLCINNELEQSWRIYMNKKEYPNAYSLCRNLGEEFVSQTSMLYADQLFSEGKYQQSAKYYLQSGLGFEEVFVKFHGRGRDLYVKMGLADYVRGFLEIYKDKLKDFHKSILVNWLADFYIHRIAFLQQKTISGKKNTSITNSELTQAQKQQEQFMAEYKEFLIEDVVYELLSSYGQLEACLKYGLQKGNFNMVVGNYVHSERYIEAIQVMNSMENCVELVYKYSDILMKKQTKQFIELIKKKLERYDLSKLMRSLMGVERQNSTSTINKDYNSENFQVALDFMEYCIKKKKEKSQMVHNIYIFLLAEHPNKELFTNYMIESEKIASIENPKKNQLYFDLNFAFNLARAHSLHRALISLLAQQGLKEITIK